MIYIVIQHIMIIGTINNFHIPQKDIFPMSLQPALSRNFPNSVANWI
jgi:hypothetical protein